MGGQTNSDPHPCNSYTPISHETRTKELADLHERMLHLELGMKLMQLEKTYKNLQGDPQNKCGCQCTRTLHAEQIPQTRSTNHPQESFNEKRTHPPTQSDITSNPMNSMGHTYGTDDTYPTRSHTPSPGITLQTSWNDHTRGSHTKSQQAENPRIYQRIHNYSYRDPPLTNKDPPVPTSFLQYVTGPPIHMQPPSSKPRVDSSTPQRFTKNNQVRGHFLSQGMARTNHQWIPHATILLPTPQHTRRGYI